ncbi:substrate-binding domain-containing protein [Paenibacillus rigui]|uniref:LacI family transcriptional regulator n=1 Tax=Paenibacillus rigui TaxID=554312 RepID=A0A229UXY1_9BACL|nr:substrate-binding domain-containing protein [Paenibacillus rigui]OXM88298.1 LacI family transcriptional regulator [Paenibacillus rigui]
MSNRIGYLGLLLLSLLFAWLLWQFMLSGWHIRQLVQPLSAPGTEHNAASRRITLISQERDNPFWRSVEQGAREAAAQYGMELGYDGPLRINPAEQSRLLEKAIAARTDAVIVQGIGDPAYRQSIDKAVASGIPVITVDTDEPGSRRLAYVGTDNLDAGKRMGELVIRAAAGKPEQIGVLLGSEQAENQRQRLSSFQSAISRYPELTVVEVRSSQISRLQAVRQTEELLARHPQVGTMVGFSALDGIGIQEAAARLKAGQLRVFAFDDLEETVEGIRHCTITASLVQQPGAMGQEAVSLLHDYFNGKTPEPQHFTATSLLDRSTLGRAAAGADCP